MPRNVSDRKLRSVKCTRAIPALLYGFPSGLESSKIGAFGQTDITAETSLQNLVIGCNPPKPARATKKTASGYDGSYCSYDVVATLKGDGYAITRGKGPKGGKSTNLSDPVYITINGIKYGWQSPKSTAAVTISQIGVKAVGASDTDIIWGCDFPKPPRLMLLTGDDRFSSFGDPESADTAASAGWILVDIGDHTTEDLARRL